MVPPGGLIVGDIFWDIATSSPVLGLIGLILGAALVVGYFPLLKWFPVIGQYVPVARLVVILSAALLCFLIGFRVSDQRAEAKALRLQLAAKEIDLKAAQNAADEADKAKADLARQAEADQERIERYEAALKARPDGGCSLTDDDLRWLRNDKPGR